MMVSEMLVWRGSAGRGSSHGVTGSDHLGSGLENILKGSLGSRFLQGNEAEDVGRLSCS
jgi:hypothetical protein